MTFCTQGNKTGMTWNVLYYHQSDSVTDRGVQFYVTVTSSDLPPIQPSSHINHKSHIKNIKSHKIETMWQKKITAQLIANILANILIMNCCILYFNFFSQ